MTQSNPVSTFGSIRVLVACLLSFAILITPIAALAAPRNFARPTVSEGKKRVPGSTRNVGSVGGEAGKASVAETFVNVPVPEPAPVPFAATIATSMTDNRNPGADPTSAKPGETINYTVTIQNTGDADATNVQFNDDVDLHTALTGTGLLAMADAYNTIGDVQISVPDGSTDLLGNDIDFISGNNTGMTATAQTISSTNCTGGCSNNVTINANGSFTYDPPVGFTGTDSFFYTSHNAANTRTANAKVQITVTGKIWFINNNAGACSSNCDGRLSHPFQTLVAFQAVNDGGVGHPQDGDVIFLYENTVGTPYTSTGTALRTNQKFIGQDATASLISLSGFTQPSGSDPLPVMAPANGNFVTIQSTAAATNGITLGSGNTLRGFTVNNTTGAKISGSSFGTLTVGNNTTPDVTLNGTGRALNLITGVFAATSGFVSVTTTSSNAQGINLSGLTGTVSFGSTTVSGNTTQCILVGTTTADINFGNTSCTGGTDGVSFQNNANVGHVFTFGTLNVSGGSGNAFSHGAGGGNVTVTGAATLSSTASAVSVNAPTATDVINFQAATSATSTGASNTGVNWVGTAGAQITFSALTIQTNGGTGLNATTGGTITVTNNTGTINNTAQNAAAIIAANVALSANFSAIKSTGGVNGVSLTTVTGTSNFGGGALSGATGSTFLVSGGSASVTYSGNITQATAAQALVSIGGTHNGTVTIDGGTLSATNGTGLQFDNADGTYNFSTTAGSTTLAGGDAGVDITNGSGGSFTFGKSGTPASFVITSPTGTAFNVDGTTLAVTAAVTYNGNITQATASQAMVNIKDHSTGAISFQGGTLSATSGTGLQFNNADGTYNFSTTAGTTTLAGGDAGVDITNGSGGSFTFGKSGTPASFVITSPTGTAFNLDGTTLAVTAAVTYNGNITQATAGQAMVNIKDHSTGAITFQGGTLSATNGTGLQFNNADSATYNFSGTNTLAGGDAGIDILNGSAGTFSFSSNTTITSPTGTAFNVGTSPTNPTITYSGTITQNTANQRVINIDGTTGNTITFQTGTITGGASSSGININNANGNVTFSNGMTLGTSGARMTNQALTITGGSGTYTLGAVSIFTNNANGLVATNADGTINCSSTSTVDSSNGTAINIDGPAGLTTLGMTFVSVNSAGGTADGISIQDTNGSFTVNGDGSNTALGGNGTGGTISGKSGADSNTTQGIGVYANNALNITLRRMTINGTNQNYGVRGNNVTNFVLQYSTIGGTNGTSTALDEGSIIFDQLLGTSNFTNLAISGSIEDNFRIRNSSSTANDIVITGSTFSNAPNDNLTLEPSSTATVTTHITNNTFTGAGGDHIQASTTNSATLNVVVTGNFYSGGFAGSLLQGITISGGNAGSSEHVNFNVSNNGSAGSPLVGSIQGGAININEGNGGGTWQGQVANNFIGNAGVAGSGSQQSSGIRVENHSPTGTMTAIVNANTIRQWAGGAAINSQVGDAGVPSLNGHLNLTVTNNVSANPVATAQHGFQANIGAAGLGSGDASIACIDARTNTLDGNAANTGSSFRMRQRENSTFKIPGYTGAQYDITAVNNFVLTQNPAAGNTVAAATSNAGPGYGNTSPPGSQCAQPTIITWMPAQTKPQFDLARVDGNVQDNSGAATLMAFLNTPTDAGETLATLDRTAADIPVRPTMNPVSQPVLAAGISAAGVTETRHEQAFASQLFAHVTSSLTRVVHGVDSLITPTAYAEKAEAGSQRSEARGQKSDVRLNHARSVRSTKGSTTSSALAPAPFAPCAPNTSTHICVDVGTLHAGDSVQIAFSVTVNNPPNLSLLPPNPRVTTRGAVTADGGINVNTDDPDVGGAADFTDTPIDLFDVKFDSLTSSVNPSTAGDSVTYTATISVDTAIQTPPGGTVPSPGSITFRDNGVDIGTCSNVAISGSGPWTAQCTIAGGTYTGGTSHPITAKYNGNSNFDEKISGTLTQDVLNCQTTATVTNTGDNGGVDPAIGAGTGTLRQAIVDVCPGGTINFNIPGVGPDTITLSAGLVLSKNVTINGPTNKTTIVNGGGTSRVFTVNSGKTVNISDLTVTNGFSAGNGGAILNDHGTLTLTNMTISGSTASLGGGIYNNGNAGTASLTITNSTLSGNTGTTNGGAIYSDGTSAGTAILALINSTISTNKTNGQGGGIFAAGASASTTVTTTNVTITNNTADFDDSSASDNGGGLFVGSGPVVTLRNTIVAGNFRGTASPVADDIQGTVDNSAASLNNLIGTGGSGGLVNGSFGNQVGVASPGLVSLNNNGGPTQTHALLLTSPAVEAGDNTTATNAGLTTDQRGTGFPRIADSADADAIQTVDIGAFELHPSVENIADKSTSEDTPFNFNFNIGDGTGALIGSVNASSNNATLVPNGNLSVTGSGSTRNLAITPATNANSPADGTATITVTVTATNGLIQQDDFVLTVTEVNNAPVPVNDTASDIDEDSGVYSIPIAPLLANDAKGPLNEGGQTLSITGVSNFTGGTAVVNGANIDFTPTLNFNGAAGFDYTAQDNGTTNGGPDFKSANGHVSFNINPINDAPSFVKGADQTVNKNAGAQTVTNWATAISAGPPDEVTAGQTVSFNVSVTGTTGSLAFTSPPAVSSSGTLTYTATNATSGTATVDVTAVDTGLGAPSPNSNTSAPQTFTITVTGVNVAPVNTVPASVTIPQDVVYTFTGAAISVADVDAAETDNIISVALNATNGTMNLNGTVGLSFTGGSNGSAAMTVQGTIPDLNTALNNMTFTPTPGYTGAASIQMVSNDLGKTGTGGPQSDDDTINITVTAGAAMYINEVLFNPPGADAPNEYIEIRGAANTTIPVGTYLVAIEGDAADNPGDVQTIINLSGLSFGSNGFLVLLQNGNTYTTDAGATVLTSTTPGFGGLPGAIFQADGGATDIEDASVTFMLIQTAATPTLTDDIDVNDDGLTDGFVFAGWNVRDSISAMNGSASARAYGAFSFRNSAGSGTSVGPEVIVNFIPSYVGRIGDSTGSTAADWVASGVLGGAAPNWTLGVAAETEPASFAGKALNHIGASNFTNLAPVNSVPAATQNVNEDFVLTFNAGNANLISISDPDAGGADVKVTLTATNGTMSLSGTAGLTFTPAGPNNDGVNDTQMIFTGTIANINTALNGMTFTPTLDYFGGASIQIVTDDQGNVGVGGAKTDTDTVNINVNAINDPPSFTLAGNPAAVNEDAGGQTVIGFASSISQGPGESGQTPLTFNVTPAGAPTGNITFASGPAIDATTGNLTYTTNTDTNGSATFNVTLSDSGSNVAPNSNTSGTQQFTITVNAVNDAPTFLIPSNPPAVNEDAGAQTVNSFTTNFQPGPPAATDEVGQTLFGYTLTQTGTTGNLTFTSAPSISNAGTLTYTPTGDTSGTATFNVVATDSGSGVAPNVNQSAPVAFTITVNGQNDAPVMDNTGNMSLNAINEDVPNASNPGTLVTDVILSAGGDRITDVDAGAVEGIAVTAANNANGAWQYSIDNGTNWLPFGTPDVLNARLLASNATTRVRFVPNLNFNGTVDPGLTFRAWDQTSGTNGNTADASVPGGITAFSTALETASITVNPDNDTPTTTGIPPVTVNEDAANTVLNLRLSFNDVEDGNDLAYTVQTNTNPSLFSSVSINNGNDNLTLAYAANASGSAQITIRGTDLGGLFVESTFTVTVNSSNDPPSFTKGPDQTTFQNSGPQTVANWATGMSPGPADESGQTLTFNVTGNTNAALFSAGPAINATTGTLTYTGANNASGNATITITLSDNGGTAFGGNDTSAPPQTFVITITPCVNPATVINTNDAGVGSLRDAITNVCTGGTINFDPALNGQTITLTSGELAINKNLTITGPGANLLTISGNNASRIFNIGNTFTVGLSGLTMSNGRVNTATSEGGAIQNNGTLTITGSTISGSTVNGSGINLGGGISNRTTGTLTLRDSTISGNSAPGGTSSDDGGGIYNQGVVTVINSTISGNSASIGGGLCMDPGSGTASIINSTVSGNSALIAGGGLHATGTINVRNTIVAGNTGSSPDVRNAFVSQGNNLIGASDGSTGFTNGVNNDKVGTVASPLNALLAPLGNYGGPTQTHALLPGSPAIDAANNCVTDAAHCGDANIPQLTTDQRGAGFNRLVNTTVDIGAFESRGFTIAIASGNLQSAVFNTAFSAPLVATVSSAFGEPVSGGQVVFTAPGSGASATFTGGVTTIASSINAGGQASASATANATVGGPYNVPATGNGITGTANFGLTNIKANQTISFGALANKTFGDPDFGINATATSGLPVSFAASGNCTVSSPSPGTVHITGAGSCTITASQAGDANYNPATDVPQSFNIAKAATNTGVSSSVNPSDLNQSVTFTATVTSGAGTPTGTVQFKDNATNLGAPVALNASGVAQFTTSALTTGTHTITADYSGDANFLTSAATLSGDQVVKAQPSLSINDVSVTEGNAGTKVLSFTVTLSAASNLTVSVDYATANGTATAPSDYAAIPSTQLTFNPGDTSKTVSVTINGDTGFEPDENFFVNLSNAVNATISDNQGLGTIQNDDALGGFISFSQPNYNVSEITGIVTVTVTRTNDVSQAASVDYATDDTGASISCAALNTGLASQRCDYTSMFGTLKFAANETQKTVDIPINLDAYTEGPEVFTFNLSNATGGAVLIASTATVTISDSPSPTPNATDDTASFVRQLYHDFLNRDADAAGLAFWKNNIDKCNDPAQRPAGQTLAQCIEVQRITTIAAFFLSIEFRQTGGLVRDFYVAALDRPATNNMPGFVEFMRDTQAIQKGVAVGQGNWQQVLDANRLAFMNEFVTRAEFVALYPTTDTPTQYVDKLYQHANVTGTQQERLDAIEYFGGAATAADTGARAKALLLVTQAGDFQDREIRRAFVHMQYLGYLRRSPNDAPDNNFDGFNFWVNKLNQFDGDYLQAEMVKAFLTSLEYRRRFGP